MSRLPREAMWLGLLVATACTGTNDDTEPNAASTSTASETKTATETDTGGDNPTAHPDETRAELHPEHENFVVVSWSQTSRA